MTWHRGTDLTTQERRSLSIAASTHIHTGLGWANTFLPCPTGSLGSQLNQAKPLLEDIGGWFQLFRPELNLTLFSHFSACRDPKISNKIKTYKHVE